mgnify:CR=1 FL=1
MPRIPTGSWPPGRLGRNVTLADFDSLRALPHGAGDYPLVPGDSITGNNWDTLTPLYRGRSDSASPLTEIQGWTRGLGTPGSTFGPLSEFRVGAVWLDIAIWNVRLVSLLVEWIFSWGIPILNQPQVGGSYRILPVKGSAGGLDPAPLTHLVQGIRLPTGWFRWTLTNEDVVDIAQNDVLMHMWLRGD